MADRPKIDVPPAPVHATPANPASLEFRHVWFRYPGTCRWVLRDITFTIRPGQSVALVGRNGAGKTTLVKLLCRLYDPDKGDVLLDGRSITCLPPDEYQRLISVVFQDFVRYHFSARMNIGVGLIEEANNIARIERAAVKSGADAFIRAFDGGYEAILGRMFQDGRELSAGQWQKVAIARAFMRDAKIVVLDEPMASLDAASEAEVLKNVKELIAGRLALLVSHRLWHAVIADRIIVIEDGAVVEQGSHTELLSRRTRYGELFRTQIAQYGVRDDLTRGVMG